MRFRGLSVAAVVLGLSLGACESFGKDIGAALDQAGGGELTADTIASGLREALEVGTRNAVAQTGRRGGYWNDAKIRIPLPGELEKFAKTLRSVGLGGEVDKLERQMNSAAEEAASGAAPIFVDAITQMTFADAKSILDGPKTAATDYFRAKTSEPLRNRYAPIVGEKMRSVGLVQTYEGLMQQYLQIPLVPKPKFTIEEYVVEKGLDGLFSVVADEERKIRKDPAARTTELLQRVFGRQGR